MRHRVDLDVVRQVVLTLQFPYVLLLSVLADARLVAGDDRQFVSVRLDLDVVGRELLTDGERQADAPAAVLRRLDRVDVRATRPPLRRQVERHLDGDNAAVGQRTVHHLVVDELGQVEPADHPLAEDAVLARLRADGLQCQLVVLDAQLDVISLPTRVTLR